MKKMIALLLALVMLLSLAACSKEDPETTTKPSGTETTGKAPTQTEPQKTDAPEEGEVLETSLWKLIYDPEVWTLDEEEFYDSEEYASVMLIIPEKDSYLVNVEITVELDDHEGFRDRLNYYDFDSYAYVVNQAYDRAEIGGVECLAHEGEYWGDPCLRYIGRDAAASVTVFVEIIGDLEDPRIAELLAGLEIFAEDIGNVDAPWPWEGEPFSASDASAMAGSLTVSAHWIPIEECVITNETFNHAVAVANGKAYILGDGELRQYAFDGDTLVFEQTVDLEGDFSCIQADENGTVWLSGFMEPLVSLVDGVQKGSWEGPDNVTMHPSGTWGISWFSGPECEKITLSGSSYTASEINFKEVSTISSLTVDQNRIYVCGSAADDSGHKVFIYDTDGVLERVLTDEEGESLGSVTFMAETGNGYIGFDGNMRRVILWAEDGSYIGHIEDGDLFGTWYPWFCGSTSLADGSILTVMTEDREDESAMELIAFLVEIGY